MPIQLPKDAREYDYEDQVCTLLLAHGYYLETRLVLKKGTEEVLEFDVIATPTNDYENRKVVEIKSGNWGLADIFKLYGQITYTDEKSAWLIHKTDCSHKKREAISEVTNQIPVSDIHIQLAGEAAPVEIPAALELPNDVAKTVFVTSWWSRSAERIAQTRFRSWFKSFHEPSEELRSAQAYLSSLSNCLFKRTSVARVDALYDAYKAAPHLTSSLIQYEVEHSGESQKQVRSTVFDRFGRPHLQFVAAQEYTARVAIIKNAYDAILSEAKKPAVKRKGLSWSDMMKELLPDSFKNGMEAMRGHPHADRIPFFLQVFIHVFGGFYFPDNGKDVSSISQATGIPEADIPTSLDILDSFFPIPNGWTHHGDGVHFLKGVPAYMRGAGSFAREDLYGKNWLKEFPQVSWQIPHWHNALYKLLEPSLQVQG